MRQILVVALILSAWMLPAMESRAGGCCKKKSSAAAENQRMQAELDQQAAKNKQDYEARKAKQGLVLKEWSLTGVIQGKGANLQFVPEKGAGGVTREIAAITIPGKDLETLESLFKQPVADLAGMKVELVFYGKPRRSGVRLLFNLMSGDIHEWRSARLLGEVEVASSDAKTL